MEDLVKIYYELYVLNETSNDFTYISKFNSKEDAVLHLLNYSTSQSMKNIYWYFSDGRLYLFDEDLKNKKAYIEICYESISNKLQDKDLKSTYLSLIDTLNVYESKEI